MPAFPMKKGPVRQRYEPSCGSPRGLGGVYGSPEHPVNMSPGHHCMTCGFTPEEGSPVILPLHPRKARKRRDAEGGGSRRKNWGSSPCLRWERSRRLYRRHAPR